MGKKSDIRWKQRFENFQKAREKFHHVLDAYQKETENEIYQIALVQAFEFTYELAWKTLKDYLNFEGVSVYTPREVIKQAFAKKIISDGQTWVGMLEDRNLMAHIYDEDKAMDALCRIENNYAAEIDDVFLFLQKKL